MKPLNERHLAVFRRHMVELIDIEFDVLAEETGRGTVSAGLREALLDIPRHLFVPAQVAPFAYQDRPLPIGFDKTISQPFIGALMVELLDLDPGDAVLEIGTGLGYLTAVLARLARHVWTIDVVEEFVGLAGPRLATMGHDNVTLRVADGGKGWPEAAPFDAILVTAAGAAPPPALIAQLKPGGRLVMPVGEPGSQRLVRIDKTGEGDVRIREIMEVQFTQLETLF